ncbi:MAG: hypothetical protein U5L95_01990 [Candidatus Saccharibacteria bacterium]|nr:hypothetical protein [Candidatus Saccharibacteria bacterium]
MLLPFRFFAQQVLERDDLPGLPNVDLAPSSIQDAISLVATILGFISVIVIIIASIKFALSQGESQKVANAKNTIIYALIGLVVSLLAYSIVNFVIGEVT